MYKNATKGNETIGKWCKNKHGASKIIDTFETYQCPRSIHFSQQKYVALRRSYNTEITQHKHTIPSKHSQARQTIKKRLFNILGLLRLCDKRDIAKELWIVRYTFESLNGKVN
jgi:hypothetical protein